MIHQGHAYLYLGERFLAMEAASRGLVLVRRITPMVPILGMERAIYVDADKLEPAPMRYHGGHIPGAQDECA